MGKREIVLGTLCLLAAVLLPASGHQAPVAATADGSAELPAETKYIALTFDDGPKKGTTDRLLDGLKERGASATFFVVGERIAEHRDLLLRMQAEGHQVGNHTWSHVRLQGAGENTIRQEVERTQQALATLLGAGEYWLRPPYGRMEEQERKLISVPMIQWSIDPRDWEVKNTEKVVNEVVKAAKPNAIILLHDIYPTSVDAALEIVDRLQKEGYWFVTVKELLTINGIQVQPGVLYRSGERKT